MIINEEYTLVDNDKSLKKLLSVLNDFEMAAIDTEADSMHHYGSKLCLIQLTVGNSNWLLDPLASLDITPVFKTKAMQILLLHGGDYDLRLLFQKYGYAPKIIFDTMLAARLLGKKHLGLSDLVQEYFDIHLEKANQKADWTIRPLAPDMADYALHDTVYLHELAALLGEELNEKKRFLWHSEMCLQLIAHASKKTLPKEEPWRITGSHHLPAKSLNLLKAVYEWREAEAKKTDRPSYKVLPPHLMLAVVRVLSATFPEIDLKKLPRLPRNFVGERLDSFMEALKMAVENPVENWPKTEPRAIPPSIVPNPDLLAALKIWRDNKALELNLEPSVLANRTQLISLALPHFDSWQKRFEDACFMNFQCEIWNAILKENIV